MENQPRKPFDLLSDESDQFEVMFDGIKSIGRDDPERGPLVAELASWLRDCARQGRYLPLASVERRALRSMLDRWTTRLREWGLDEEGIDTLATFDPTAGSVLSGECPYPGLEPYTQSERGSFFGRESVVSQCIAHLDQPGNRVLMIIGASGSGKSSMAMAGVVPKLQEAHSDTWCFGRFTPGLAPLNELAIAVATAARQGSGVAAIPQDPQQISQNIGANPANAWAELATCCNNRPLFLLVDQFEELLTIAPDTRERATFSRVLEAITDPAPSTSGFSCRVLITLRTDHQWRLENAVEFRELYRRLVENQLSLPPIGFNDIRRAIKGPADEVGLRFVPPELIDRLAGQTAGLANGLPLLQFALRQLWDSRPTNSDGERIDLVTKEMVDRLPDVQGALGAVAEGIFQTFTGSQQEICKRLLLELVVLDESFEEPLRRRRPEAELVRILEARFPKPAGDVSTVINAFVSAGLLRRFGESPGGRIEVAHEALLRQWDRVNRFLIGGEVKERLHLIKKITQDAAEWAGRGRAADYLTLRGDRLARALEYGKDGWLADSQASAYVDACREEEQQQQAKDQRHAAARAFWGKLATTAAGVALLISGYLAWSSNQRESQSAVQSMQLAEEQQDPHAQLALVADALRHDPDLWPVASRLLGGIRRQAQLFTQNFQHNGAVYSAVFSPDDRYVVTASQDKTACVWSIETGECVGKMMHDNEVTYAEFSSSTDNGHIITASRDGSAKLWTWNEGKVGKTSQDIVPVGPEAMNNARFSPNGQLLVTVSGLSAKVWNVSGQLVAKVDRKEGAVLDAEFSGDGRRVVIRTAGKDNAALVFDIDSKSVIQELRHPPGSTSSATPLTVARIDSEGRRVLTAAADADGSVIVWDIDPTSMSTYKPFALSVPDPPAATLAADFSTDGEWLVTADAAGRAFVWKVASNFTRQALVDEGAAPRIATVKFVAGRATKLVTALENGTSRVYEMDPTAEGTFKPFPLALFHRDAVRMASFNRDGTKVVTASIDGTARLWDFRRRSAALAGSGPSGASQTAEPTQIDKEVLAADLSPDGLRMAVAYADGLWLASKKGGSWIRDDQRLATGPARILGFSRDSKWIIASMDLRTRQAGLQLFGPNNQRIDVPLTAITAPGPGDGRVVDQVVSAAFSPEVGMWAAGSYSGAIRVSRPGAAEVLECRHAAPVSSLQFSSDGRSLLSASYDSTSKLWALTTGRCEEVRSFAHPGVVYGATFGPSDARVLTASQGGARLWDSRTGLAVQVLDGGHPFDDAEFSQDGDMAVTASAREVQLWDLKTGRRLGAAFPRGRQVDSPRLYGPPPLSRARFNSDASHVIVTDRPRVEMMASPNRPSGQLSYETFAISVDAQPPRRGLPFLMRAVRWTFWPNDEWGEISDLLEAVGGLKLRDQRLEPIQELGQLRKGFYERAQQPASRIDRLAQFFIRSELSAASTPER